MWFDRGRSFGGLRKRYKAFPNGMVEALDPVSADIVAFKTELQYDNWLLRRFDPAIQDLDIRPKRLAQMRNGKRTESQPALAFRNEKGPRIVEWVVAKGSVEPCDLEAVVPFEKSHRVKVSVRARDTIRGNQVLLANLDHVRQTLAMHVNVDLAAEQRATLQALQEKREMELALLLARAQSQSNAALSVRVEAALLRLFADGTVKLNLSEVPYGTKTIISF